MFGRGVAAALLPTDVRAICYNEASTGNYSIFRYKSKMSLSRLPYVWDYAIDEDTFRAILAGDIQVGRLDQDWAAVRLLEYAPYAEIIRLLGYGGVVIGWPRWRERVRAENRRRGLDFLVSWLPLHHPELL